MNASSKSSSYLHQQITESLREDITSGQIPVGSRLPTMKALAKDWGTSYFTIWRALAPLVREGLLESRGKLGMNVVGPKPTLTCVGIYYGLDVWRISETAFYRSIHQELCRQIEGAGITVKQLVEARPTGQQNVPQAEVAKAVEDRSIQGLIVPITNEAEMSWISQLPVPKAYLGNAPVPWGVTLDRDRGLQTALLQLHQEGVRDVGLITGFSSHHKVPHPLALFFQNFVDLLEELGMRTRNHWCAAPERYLKPHENEQFGYESFQKIWNTNPRQRPDGLICVSDVVGRGLFSALLEKQISVPERLKVVQYKNKHTGFFTPLKARWIEWDEAAVASALFRQLQGQIQGEEPQKILISPCLE